MKNHPIPCFLARPDGMALALGLASLALIILRNAVAHLKSFEIQGWTRDLSEWKESPNG